MTKRFFSIFFLFFCSICAVSGSTKTDIHSIDTITPFLEAIERDKYTKGRDLILIDLRALLILEKNPSDCLNLKKIVSGKTVLIFDEADTPAIGEHAKKTNQRLKKMGFNFSETFRSIPNDLHVSCGKIFSSKLPYYDHGIVYTRGHPLVTVVSYFISSWTKTPPIRIIALSCESDLHELGENLKSQGSIVRVEAENGPYQFEGYWLKGPEILGMPTFKREN